MTVASPGTLSNATKVEPPRAHRNHNHAGTVCESSPADDLSRQIRAAKAAGEKEGDEGERDEVVHADTAGEHPQGTKRMGGLLKRGRKCSTDKGRPRELSAL